VEKMAYIQLQGVKSYETDALKTCEGIMIFQAILPAQFTTIPILR
jgi:hypothetical protein